MNIMKRNLLIVGAVVVSWLALSFAPSARANVYATNIKLNGNLTNSVSVGQGSSVTITYILNEPATAGVTIDILSGETVIRSISVASGDGTNRGLNTVAWDGKTTGGANAPVGSYSVRITAAATGYSDWTKISVDTDPAMVAHYPWGMDVDRNTNSPFYGRVVMGCSIGTAAIPAKTGLYKMNADGSIADDGWFGYAGYTTNDGGLTAIEQMPAGPTTGHNNPATIRIGEDDRIYWSDNSAVGAIISCDMQMITNQIVITGGTYNSDTGSGGHHSHFNVPNTYQDCPEVSYLDQLGTGVKQFDVCGSGTNMALYLVDSGDFPSWGIWMFHMTNGVSDTNDTMGTQAISTINDAGLDFTVTAGGVMVDHNLDIFASQNRSHGDDPLDRTLAYTNWNGGVLLPPNTQIGYSAADAGAPPAAWKVGSADPYMSSIFDTVINSRDNPTMVAVAMAAGQGSLPGGYNNQNGGIRILSAIDGSTIVTNLDFANWYNGVAFDNVGNVYGCSRSSNLWRVWSPPGANEATTLAVATIDVSAAVTPAHITGINVSGSTVTISFTADESDSADAFHLQSSGTVDGPYVDVESASATQVTPGVFSFTVSTSGDAQFYLIRR
jgi:hypothetical protein